MVACSNCEPEAKGLTKRDLNTDARNKQIRKKIRQNWSIPVVYSGMNTGKR